MQLFDRLCVVAMTDSIGECKTLLKLFNQLEMPMHPVLCRWAKNKDRDDNKRQQHRKKRAIAIIEKIKDVRFFTALSPIFFQKYTELPRCYRK